MMSLVYRRILPKYSIGFEMCRNFLTFFSASEIFFLEKCFAREAWGVVLEAAMFLGCLITRTDTGKIFTSNSFTVDLHPHDLQSGSVGQCFFENA